MAYNDDPMGRVIERPVAVQALDYHDRVRWGPIFAGLVIAISMQLVLSGIGAALGLSTIAGSDAPRSNANEVGSAVGYWSIISLLIALFLGGLTTARACGPMNRNTAILNGGILWATTLAISAWLLTSGVSGTFGLVLSNAGDIIDQAQQSGANLPATTPNVTAQETRNIAGNAAKIGWSFAFGSLLSLIASLVGATVGTRNPRTTVTQTTVEPRRS